jgi:SAM-dependent methyltransferase
LTTSGGAGGAGGGGAERAARGRPRLGPSEAALFETFVVPRYLSLFGDVALDLVAEAPEAQVAHLACRTGYPDRGLAVKLPGAHIYGCDASPHAIELARAKAATMPTMVGDYRASDGYPVPLPSAAFSHALSLHPSEAGDERAAIVREFARLLAPLGQALLAVPLRGSFQEVWDLLREYALKHDDAALGRAIETATVARPTAEILGAELEEAGFSYVDVELQAKSIAFQGGRDFFEDPVTRLVIVPELRAQLGDVDVEKPLAYVRDAIDLYWSEAPFELSVQVGCATGRRNAVP